MVSLCSSWLFFSVFFCGFFFFCDALDTQLFVDSSLSEKFKIHMDVTFPNMPCSYLTLDAMDVSGDHQLDIVHNVFKKRLDSRGRVVESAKREKELARDQKPVELVNVTEGYCGSCYGSEDRKGQCCNTCDEVKAQYRKKGWSFGSTDRIEQCVREGVKDEIAAVKGEGCNIFGFLEVRRVQGNFHFAPGASFTQQHMHVHDLAPFKGSSFDLSHNINSLTFGEAIPSSSVSQPLSGHKRTSEKGEVNVMHQYFVKVVPTVYQYMSGRQVSTNQYSVTEHKRQLGPGKHGLPGVFFMYDFSPIMIKISEKEKGLGHFLVGICAIIGGVFTVMGMIDSVLFHGLNSIKKKMELGKLS